MIDTNKILNNFKEKMTLDGRKRVFEDSKELSSEHLKEPADPEAVTKTLLIEKILDGFGLERLPEKHYKWIKELKKADYRLKNQKGIAILVEAKSLNADLYKTTKDGGINQIKDFFRLVEAREENQFGIATDGIKWIFIDRNADIVFKLNIFEDLENIEELLIGKREVSAEEIKEQISSKFYQWYNALLHGGTYKDHENKKRKIAESDCLIENILNVTDIKRKEQIAQIIMNRLIFIKFLQAKKIIDFDVLNYFVQLDEDILNYKLKQLFFQILNTEINERMDIDPKFKSIPYLNGSLFERTKIEIGNYDYKIRVFILKEVIIFLDSFSFTHEENSTSMFIDPEILGYIFEKSMTADDRSGSGSYYTRKTITRFISENTIYPVIITKTNALQKEKGYKESELVKTMDDIYGLKNPTLRDVYLKIILKLRICDNAVGSGAFLLSAANILLEVYKTVNEELRSKDSEIAMRKLILKNNLYGVDKNPNAVEIAKLRLWLWLANIYEPDKVEALPNIDYKLRVGNSLFGYKELSQFQNSMISLDEFWGRKESFTLLLKEREKKIITYNSAKGKQARKIKIEIDEIDDKVLTIFQNNYYKELHDDKIKAKQEDFQKLQLFHWGYEFSSVFSSDESSDNGFDIIIGNPPYGNILSNLEKKLAKNQFSCLKANDIAENFFERSFTLLNNNGILGYVTPKSIAFYVKWREIRHLLLGLNLTHIYDVGLGFVGVNFEEIVMLIQNKKNEKKNVVNIYVAEVLKSSLKSKMPIYQGIVKQDEMIKHDIILFRNIDDNEREIITHIDNSCIKFREIYSEAFRGLYIPDKDKKKILKGSYRWINKVPDVQKYYLNKIMEIELTNEKWKEKAKKIMNPRLFFKVLRGNRLVCYADVKGEYLTTEKLVNVTVKKDSKYNLKLLMLIINSTVPSFYIQKMLFSETTETSRVMDDSYVGEIPIPKTTIDNEIFDIMYDYILFLNSNEEIRNTEKELIEFVDEELIKKTIYEIYFGDILDTKLMSLIKPYMKNIHDIKDIKTKLENLRNIIDNIKSNTKIIEELRKINEHPWIKTLEATLDRKGKTLFERSQ